MTDTAAASAATLTQTVLDEDAARLARQADGAASPRTSAPTNEPSNAVARPFESINVEV